jgi:hypothetical protein
MPLRGSRGRQVGKVQFHEFGESDRRSARDPVNLVRDGKLGCGFQGYRLGDKVVDTADIGIATLRPSRPRQGSAA